MFNLIQVCYNGQIFLVSTITHFKSYTVQYNRATINVILVLCISTRYDGGRMGILHFKEALSMWTWGSFVGYILTIRIIYTCLCPIVKKHFVVEGGIRTGKDKVHWASTIAKQQYVLQDAVWKSFTMHMLHVLCCFQH